jgi:selenocysteine lyase/cysteine desulfurase
VNRRIYLDNAATSWPKPAGVLAAAMDYQTGCGAAAGRGNYTSSIQAGKIVQQARTGIAQWTGTHAERIALLANGTQALNAALMGLIRPGHHVVTTATEHNSVLRPLAQMESDRGISWTAVPCDGQGVVSVDDLRQAIRRETLWMVVSHASNVTGAIQDIDAIARLCQEHNVHLVLDLAQTLGYVPIDVQRWRVGAAVAPCHKGMGALLGCAFFYLAEELVEQYAAPWTGGTGQSSDDIYGPFAWRDSIEAGNLNMPAIASIPAALRWLEAHLPQSRSQLAAWTWEIVAALDELNGLKRIGPGPDANRLATVSMVSASYSPHELAALLDAQFQIETRAGFHCAGLIHPFLATKESGGTLRLSLGHLNVEDDWKECLRALQVLHT